MKTVPHNIYIHIPYCKSKCRYCAFFSRACHAPDWAGFAAGIISEIIDWRARLGRVEVPTVFFGGGTPSLMPTNVFAKIMDAMRANFDISPDAEITAEANPGTLDAARLGEFVVAGMNRLSIGIQSLNDTDLRWLGRTHTACDALKLLDAAARHPIRTSADFIYALPGWNADRVVAMCRDINALGLKHCSLYELTIEDGTPLAAARPDMPDNDAMADMYAAIGTTLSLPRYEVSNYAAPGFECRHNQNVWDGAPYIGIGTGAAGRVFLADTWYEQTGGVNGIFSPMTAATRATEKLITGLRTARGVAMTADVSAVVNMEYVRTHPDMIKQANGRLVATQNGLLILDELLLNLVE